MGLVTRRAGKAALIYLALGLTWILATSLGLGALRLDLETQTRVEVVKGVAFVLISAALIFAIVRANLRRLARERSARAKAQVELAAALHRSSAAVLAASVAHDLNNVLVTLFTEVDDLTAEPAQTERMSNALERAAELSRALMHAGEPDGMGEVQSFDAVAVVREALEAARRHRSVRSAELESDLPDELLTDGFPRLLYRVVVNLTINAADAHPGGQILVRLRKEGSTRLLEVHDDGPGFPEESMSRLLEPFFTTKETGTGLGLVSVRLCAELHSGRVEFGRSSELGGALVRLALGPASPSMLPPAPRP
ncbi:MAG: hypothetical protein Rubg2KO_41030 [Rubricoccaceae bacterium]